jgi:hypothetical protein
MAVTTLSLIQINNKFGGIYCLHLQGQKVCRERGKTVISEGRKRSKAKSNIFPRGKRGWSAILNAIVF